jgi:hypothetical protein
MTTKRLLHLLAMIMIGKGALIAISPRPFLELWKTPWNQRWYQFFEDRPQWTRVAGIVTVVAGFALGCAVSDRKRF